MELFAIILDILIATGAYIIDNAAAIATLAGVAMALYGLNHWKREYRFKRNSELLEEAFVKAKDTASGFENGLRIEFRKILKNKRQGAKTRSS